MPREKDSAARRDSARGATLEEHLASMGTKELQAIAERHRLSVGGTRRKRDLIALLIASSAAGAIRRELGVGRDEDKERLQGDLAATLTAIREAANVGASIRLAEDSWKAAADALEAEDLVEARDGLDRAARRITEARDRRIREIGATIDAVSEHLVGARDVGAETSEAAGILEDARQALVAQEYPRADDLVKRAERLAMQVQQRQIERALRLREEQVERAEAIVASCEPLLQEAESYDLPATEVRTLLRQARDVLAKGDYVAGLMFARNAQEAAYRLEAQVEEERRQRGILRPASGVCGACGSAQLLFYDDGRGRCAACGAEFRWREPFGIRERFRELLGT